MKAFVGIDPGKSGGVGLVLENGQVAELLPMPSTAALANKLDEWKSTYHGEDGLFVGLEKAQAMPKQGVVSMFNYGDHFGQIQGVLIAMEIPYELVTPQAWGKEMHAGIAKSVPAKARSTTAALRLFPGLSLAKSSKATKEHLGIVEALLIAEWERRKHG